MSEHPIDSICPYVSICAIMIHFVPSFSQTRHSRYLPDVPMNRVLGFFVLTLSAAWGGLPDIRDDTTCVTGEESCPGFEMAVRADRFKNMMVHDVWDWFGIFCFFLHYRIYMNIHDLD